MAYERIRAGDLLDGAAMLTGRDWSELKPAEMLRNLKWLKKGLDEVWIWKDWSLLCVLEEVFYRPTWTGSAVESAEVYHAGEYWRALADTSAEPAEGEADWERFAVERRLLELPLSGPGGCFKLWRVFREEPKHVDGALGLLVETTAAGIEVIDDRAGNSVWVWYAPVPPDTHATQVYDPEAETVYLTEARVFDPETGDVYVVTGASKFTWEALSSSGANKRTWAEMATGGEKALTWTGAEAANAPAYWDRQDVPKFLGRFLEHYVAQRQLIFDRNREMAATEYTEIERGRNEAWDLDEQFRKGSG